MTPGDILAVGIIAVVGGFVGRLTWAILAKVLGIDPESSIHKSGLWIAAILACVLLFTAWRRF